MRHKQLIAQANAGNPTTFITLTSNPATGSCPASRARSLVHAWRTIVKRAKAMYGYDRIPFLAVFEATKRGEPHLHILARVPWISQAWLSNQMEELAAAPIVDIRRIKSARQVALYVAKYVGKEPHRFETCKRYWSTRDYDQSEPGDGEGDGRWSADWYITCKNIFVIEMLCRRAGGTVEWDGDTLIVGGRSPPWFSDTVLS